MIADTWFVARVITYVVLVDWVWPVLRIALLAMLIAIVGSMVGTVFALMLKDAYL